MNARHTPAGGGRNAHAPNTFSAGTVDLPRLPAHVEHGYQAQQQRRSEKPTHTPLAAALSHTETTSDLHMGEGHISLGRTVMPLFVFTIIAGITTLVDSGRTTMQHVRRNEDGASTVEWVLITGAVIGLAAIVLVAVKAFVNSKIGQIQ